MNDMRKNSSVCLLDAEVADHGGGKGAVGGFASAGSPSASQPRLVLVLDVVAAGRLAGWALDRISSDVPAVLLVILDDRPFCTLRCDQDRPDVASITGRNKVGFSCDLPARLADGLPHRLRFELVNGTVVPITSGVFAGEAEVVIPPAVPGPIQGNVDGQRGTAVHGWVVRTDLNTGTKFGAVRLLVSDGTRPIAEITADEFRPDVASSIDCPPSCGFVFNLPLHDEMLMVRNLTFRTLPDLKELPGSPVELDLGGAISSTEAQILLRHVDDLLRSAFHLRNEISSRRVAGRYSLQDYARWAAESLPLAASRARVRYGMHDVNDELVSIVCPVFRPEICDLIETIKSVQRQTHVNWELILVDDASNDTALDAAVRSLAAQDARLRYFARRTNFGISRATNFGIGQVSGRWIAFLDHDDVLEPAALEIMLLAARATGARLLYSDEDKIDLNGRLVEPFFKPDFSPRMLLGWNYICHFVIMQRSLVEEVGELDAGMDGAQDHDFLLRASECLKSTEVHHVPEVLYHWRKSPTSTAMAGAAKPYAGRAGAAAVARHLERISLPAAVKARPGTTIYDVTWDFQSYPGVSIIIPFRNNIAMTRACVKSIFTHTANVPIQIILTDNWSTESDVEAFRMETLSDPRILWLRIAEPFNYSRINNLAANRAIYSYILLLNNDVEITEDGWLGAMLGECMAAPEVAAVGIKLLYPSGSVQHSGVVLGVGGVADHVLRGAGPEEHGYAGRGAVPHEVSAVTAACLLVRRSAFDEVGGLNAEALTVAFNDVELCLKLREAGYRIVMLPNITAIHHESYSRGQDTDYEKLARFVAENQHMNDNWAKILAEDPYYSPHFSRERGIYRDLRVLKPEEVHPISSMDGVECIK